MNLTRVNRPSMSEWLDLMLGEIARKSREQQEALDESNLREEQAGETAAPADGVN